MAERLPCVRSPVMFGGPLSSLHELLIVAPGSGVPLNKQVA